YNLMYRQTAPFTRHVAMIAVTLLIYGFLTVACLWLKVVDLTLYGRRPLKLFFRLFRLSPVIVVLVLLVLNFFFRGLMYDISQENTLVASPPLYLVTIAVFLLFLSTAFSVIYYDRNSKKVRFLHVAPVIIAVFAGYIPQLVTPYNTLDLGFAIACSFLFFSMENENLFVDAETGFYNKRYLAYLFDLSFSDKNTIHSVFLIDVKGNMQTATQIIDRQLHQIGDVIRAGEDRFLMFSPESSRSTLQYESSLIQEAVKQYNEEHSQDKVEIFMRCQMRTKEQDTFSFLQAVLEGKEVGNEMRGIMSMIADLDRLDNELKLAADIQVGILPNHFPAFPERQEFDLFASMTPAKEVGGDFYDFFLIDSDHLAVVIADVSGKGIPAALFMMISKTLLKNQLLSGCGPDEALERVNAQLYERNSSMMFVTVWLGILEISTGKGMACNAGHENPGLRREGGGFELLRYKHNGFLGVMPKMRYQKREFTLSPGDCIFVYTDGVPEATNAKEQMFGEDRLQAVLNENASADPKELITRVHDAVDRFADGAPQFDDITMLCLKYRGVVNKEE
ncbi:MAG: PP2C family protein-serine/threonine phosphatase, partial [Blautia sp.]|nr:PP2C family protein-serine/threonine phosphatase [Blautia sp.]